MIKKILKHPLFSGSLIMVGGNMIANVINYLYHLVMGRVLGPVDYGVLASLYSILYLIGIIPMSASVAIVKYISSAKEDEAYPVYLAIKKVVVVIAICLALLVLAVSPLISKFLHLDGVHPVIMISPILFLTLSTLVNQSTAQGLLKFSGNVIPVLISSTTKFVLGVTFIYLGWSVFGAMFAIAIGLALAYLYSAWFIKRNLKRVKTDKPYDISGFLSYSLPVLVQALAFTSLFSTDVLLVKHFFNPFDAGIYAALSTLGKIIFFATSPVTATMFPIVSKRKANNEGYKKVFFLSLLIVLGVSLSITGFYWLFPEVTIGLLYGSAYLAAAPELVWMAVFILVYSLSSLLVNYSLALGSSKVIVFPLLVSVAQVILVWTWHESLLQVIQISLGLTMALFVSIIFYLSYNRLLKNNG